MHIVDWAEAQEADAALVTCRKWAHLRRDMPLPKWDALLKKCLEMEGRMLFCICNSLILNKGLMYVSTTPKGETEGVLTFCCSCGSMPHGTEWCASECQSLGSTEDLGSHSGEILVADDGRRLPRDSERMPAWSSI